MNQLQSFIAEGEHKYQEFKEDFSKSILKTISAFANNHDGRIIIGVSDNGDVVGVINSKDLRMSIENTINDSIRPRPYYEVRIMRSNNKEVLIFDIYKGSNTPYTYNNKAFERLDTSTVEVDRDKYDELVLLGKNLRYEELPYEDTQPDFSKLERLLIDNLDINQIDLDVIKSLGLYKYGKYTIAAGLLADKNSFDEIGIDIIRYADESMQIIDDRISLNGVSILEHYEKCILFFDKYIKQKDIIKGEKRITFYEVPKTAFREAVINAIIHRDYNRKANNRIEFFSDRIEILSVGSLPLGTSEEEYKRGSYSNVRNRILADIFFRVGYIEKMGTGIRRIKQSYSKYKVEPTFEVMTHSIRVILPLISPEVASEDYSKIASIDLNDEELKLYNYFISVDSLRRLEVEKFMNVGKTKANNLLNKLLKLGLINKVGQGIRIQYKINIYL